MNLGWLDLLVLVGYLASAIVVGLSVSGKSKNLEAYLVGDRDLPWWAILGSIVAAETSTATVLSVPGEASGVPGTEKMGTGLAFLQLALGYIVGRAIIVQLLLPLYFRGQLFTAYEVLDQRFGGVTKQAASLLFLVARNLGDGLRLFLAAVVLHKLADLPFAMSVVVMGVVTTAYTLLGGMRSVVWNDCIQFVVYMVGGLVAVLVIASQVPGGWEGVFQFAREHDKFRVFDFTFSLGRDYTFWSGLIGGAVLAIGTHGTDHMMVQRYLSARSEAEAGRALLASGTVVLLQFALFLFIGVELAAYYAHQPEVVFQRGDEVFAAFIVNHFPDNTGLKGLMLAAVLASALSSSLNAVASAVVNDFYVTWRRTPATSEQLFSLTRLLTIVFGVVQIVIGIWAQYLDETVVRNALTIAGFAAGLLLGVFALGVLTQRVGQAAALTGALAGLGMLSSVQFGLPWFGYKVAFPWLALIGASTTFAVGYLMSWVWPRQVEAEA